MSLAYGNKHECIFVDTRITKSWEEHIAKVLGVHIDKNLTFTNHYTLCKNAGRKINMMAGIAIHLSESKKKILLRTFFNRYSAMVHSFGCFAIET